MRIVFRYCFLWWKKTTHCRRQPTPHAIYTHTVTHTELETNKYLKRHNKMAAASLRNVEIAAATAAEVADDGGGDKNNSSRHTSCSGYSNQHTYHQQELEQPKKRNIYHQTTNCHYHHAGASILFWLAVILVLGELKTGEFIFVFLLFSILCAARSSGEMAGGVGRHIFTLCARRGCHKTIFWCVCMHKTVRATQNNSRNEWNENSPQHCAIYTVLLHRCDVGRCVFMVLSRTLF